MPCVTFSNKQKGPFATTILFTALMVSLALINFGCDATPKAQAQEESSPESKESSPEESVPTDSLSIDSLSIDSLNKALQQFTDTVTKTSSEYGAKMKDAAEEEYRKLIKFEYKVVDVPRNASTDEIESVLTSLGAERWNCFHADTLESVTRLYCRRLPFSVLRIAPYLW
jgi:hypothetical protein